MTGAGRWRRRLGRALLLAVVAVLVFCVLAATTPLDEALLAAVASRATGVEVTIGAVDWSVGGRHRVGEIAARMPDASAPFFTVAEAAIELGLFPPVLRSVRLERPHLVATERADGSFDLRSLLREPTEQGAAKPPILEIRGGTFALAGAGPLHQRLAQFLAPDVAVTMAIERLSLLPGDDGTVSASGRLLLCGVVPVELHAAIAAGRLVGVEAALDPEEGIDLGAMREKLAAPVAGWLRENELTGRLGGAVRLVGAPESLSPVAEIALAELRLVPAAFPVVVERLSGRLALRDGSLFIEGLHGACGDAALSIHGEVIDLAGAATTRVVTRFDGATLDDRMRAACATDRVGKMLLEAFEPAGRWSCTATVLAGNDRDFRFELDLGLDDLSGCFRGFLDDEGRRHGFPMRFERVRGRVVAAPDRSWFRDVVGFTTYGGSARASGEILGVTVTGEVESDQLRIDDEILSAAESELGAAIPQLVRDLGLGGTFATVARYSLDAENRFSLALGITPRAITLLPRAFPFKALLDAGTVRVDDGGIRLEALTGSIGGGSLRIDGEIALLEDPPFEVRAAARGVVWSRELQEALRAVGSDELTRRIESMAPAGRFDADLVIAREASGAELVTTLALHPLGIDLTLAESLRASGIRGGVEITLRGEGPAEFALLPGGLVGQLGGGDFALLPPNETGGLLRAEVRAIAVDESLAATLEPTLPRVAELLHEHHVRGHFRGGAAIDPGGPGRSPGLAWIELAPDHASDAPRDQAAEIVAEPPWLPLPLSWRSGVMHIDVPTGEVMFGRLEGRLGDARAVVGGGSFAPTADGLEARLDMQLDGLPFVEFLELVVGDERMRAMNAYGPIGKARAELQELTFTLGAGGDALERLSARGLLDAHGFSFYASGALREVTGRLQVESLAFERRDDGRRTLRAEGALSRVTIQVGEQRFMSLDAELLLQDDRLSIPWLAADFAGGRLPREKNHFALDLSGAMPFEGRLEVVAADVSRVLGDDVPSMRSLVGRVDASVGLRGGARTLLRNGEVTDLEAGGSLRIADAKLWSIPVFDKLYSLAVLPLIGLEWGGASEPPRWTRGAIDFALQGIVVQLSRIELEGEPLILRGTGTLGPERLRLDFYPEVRTGLGFVRDLPIVGLAADFLFGLLEKQVGAFVFVGPYASPEVVWDPVLLPREEVDIEFERPRTSQRRSRATAERF
jgi:hypothetical protein